MHAVPKMGPPGGGPCLGSFFEVFVSGLQKRKVLEARNFVAYGDRKGNWGGPFERSWF